MYKHIAPKPASLVERGGEAVLVFENLPILGPVKKQVTRAIEAPQTLITAEPAESSKPTLSPPWFEPTFNQPKQ